MSLDDPRPDGPHARLQGLLAPPRVGLSMPHGPSAPAAPVHGPSAPHAPTAGEDALSAQALARAAVDYRASYGDPVVRAAAVPRRRVRWVVPWRLAAAAGVLVVLLAGSVALRQLALHPGAPVTLPVPVPAASSGPAVAGGASAGAGTAVQADAQAVDGATGSEMVVHVVGQVAAPGVVRLPAGARVADAIAAAGGSLAQADLAALNLARAVTDGEQIRVPAVGESPAQPAGAAPGDERVDLNTADLATLDALPGIGPVLAQRILDHRSTGPFTSVDELDDVSGVGPALLADLRELVRV